MKTALVRATQFGETVDAALKARQSSSSRMGIQPNRGSKQQDPKAGKKQWKKPKSA
ncbi:hypothetical protein NKI79_02865 [Mesorhizobium sp. M0340]|uniref:hypothetical protein n=1 Tax=Mesorhizobium sp. M0340 TaxID=2956939 RepID=UPI00333CFFB8